MNNFLDDKCKQVSPIFVYNIEFIQYNIYRIAHCLPEQLTRYYAESNVKQSFPSELHTITSESYNKLHAYNNTP